MNDKTAERLILMMQKYIEAMGMQAENDQRKVIGESMAYTEHDFNEVIFSFHKEAP